MKILKIELQNINSLKSDKPIIIDFEGEHFKDVGLYAITGSTGAGKTTILDAITIALYHQVPRFRKSNSNAGLEDVVSYGAGEAFSRVLFENNNERYEAFWGLRLVSKNGKKLSKPIETVQLINSRTGKIIAAKKREVQQEVERVTQLSYNQFLRSVMLAQGEFASFLSAKAKDKGTLLEQITGEEIYKKIGEAINQRHYEEGIKLKDIQAEINSEDLLSDEDRKELLIEQKEVEAESKAFNKELRAIKSITDWYKKSEALQKQEKELHDKNKKLETEKKEQQNSLNRLKLHDKAEPFKELLQKLQRTEKEISDNTSNLNKVNKELEELNPKIEAIKKEKTSLAKELQEAEDNFKHWLPKLEEVTKLDATITGVKEKKKSIDIDLAEVEATIKKEKKIIFEKEEEKKEKNTEKNLLETFIENNKYYTEIEQKFTKWSTDLTVLKNKKKRIATEQDDYGSKQKEIEQTNLKIKRKNEKISRKNIQFQKEEKELALLKEQLEQNKIQKIIQKKEILEKERMLWDSFSRIATSFKKDIEEEKKLRKTIADLKQQKSIQQEKIKALDTAIEIAKGQVEDAEKIVVLEHAIKSLEEERSKLEKGKPCVLCGSTEHPFVEKYALLETSNSEKELENRKKHLNKATEKKIAEDKILTEVKTNIKRISEQLQKIIKEIDEHRVKAAALKIDATLTDTKTIADRLETLTKQLQDFETKIKAAHNLQEEKDKKEKEVQELKEEINAIKNSIASLEGTQRTLKKEAIETKTTLVTLQKDASLLETALNQDMAVFKLQVPSIENTSAFIGELEENIAKFNKKKKELVTVQSTLSTIAIVLKTAQEQLEKAKGELKILQDKKSEIKALIKDLTKKRELILPLSISVENKRSILQEKIKAEQKKLEEKRAKLQELKTDKTTKKTQKDTIQENLKKQKTVLEASTKSFDKQVELSDFGTRKEVELALLNRQEELAINKIKKELEEKYIEITTLQERLQKEVKQLEESKDFETSKEQALKKEIELRASIEAYLKRSGEISQRFALDNQIKERNKDVFNKIKIQEKEVKKWKDLINLLGGSKHAFNTYVQRLTLQRLIGFANLHLYKLNKRYSLKMEEAYKPGEELNFNLIDHYQTDQSRYVDTSSGGEKFIISLALALGLSDLASANVRIDSLFIDEGFGTLDTNTLETVITTLETLQSQGKMIGIISHVANLKERISTQIQILKKSNGVSEVKLV